MSEQGKADAFVRTRVREKLSPRVRKLIAQANFDLYHGPSARSKSYPGFTAACERLGGILDMVGELWVDPHLEWLSRKEPRRPAVFDTLYKYERRDVARAVFGEVAGYL